MTNTPDDNIFQKQIETICMQYPIQTLKMLHIAVQLEDMGYTRLRILEMIETIGKLAAAGLRNFDPIPAMKSPEIPLPPEWRSDLMDTLQKAVSKEYPLERFERHFNGNHGATLVLQSGPIQITCIIVET